MYSTTKGLVALAAHMLVDRGKLDLDAPVAQYWPEFAQAGKERLPVRYLLTHQAGLPDIHGELPAGAALNWQAMTTALAAARPRWDPGTKQGYHTSTFGWLVGEVIRQISGKTPGQFIRDEIAKPLGISFHLGFNPIGYHVAEILQDNRQGVANRGPTALRGVASAMRGVNPNSREYRMAELPAGNGHTNARALATVYGTLARGGEWGEDAAALAVGDRASLEGAGERDRRDAQRADAPYARFHAAVRRVRRRAPRELVRPCRLGRFAGVRRSRETPRLRLRNEPDDVAAARGPEASDRRDGPARPAPGARRLRLPLGARPRLSRATLVSGPPAQQ